MFLSSCNNTGGSLGEPEMLSEHEASVSTACLNSPKLSQVFLLLNNFLMLVLCFTPAFECRVEPFEKQYEHFWEVISLVSAVIYGTIHHISPNIASVDLRKKLDTGVCQSSIQCSLSFHSSSNVYTTRSLQHHPHGHSHSPMLVFAFSLTVFEEKRVCSLFT